MSKIVQKDNSTLRQIAKKVKISEIRSAKIKKVISNMDQALKGEEDGVAVAAPQIGVSLRIFLVSGKMFATDSKEGDVPKNKVFINPSITKQSKKKEEMEEGCLSIRWKYGKVIRSTKASVSAYDENGKKFTHTASGALAQVFQHETDHLNGILFIDIARDVRDIAP